MLNSGSISFNSAPHSKPTNEFKYLLKRAVIDFFGAIFLIVSLPIVLLINKLIPSKKRRIMVGTHPIVSNIHYKYLLEHGLPEYEIEIFIFEDWLNEKSYYDISAKDIFPKWIVGKNAYDIAPYFVLLWALRKYNGFYWHFDGAILERTFLWRVEPLILELFGKRVIMQAYGADQWTILQSNNNLNFKIGLTQHRKRYFMMDLKKIKRNYMWCKYVHQISGDVRYLPVVNSFSLAHFFVETNELEYNVNQNLEKIIISHFANHPERKGSNAIKVVCNNLIKKGYNIEYRAISGVKREEALRILDSSHIFIEHLFNGIIGTGCLEAMAKGNIVLTNIDDRLIDLALVQDYEFYSDFFDNAPIINVNIRTLEKELISIINEKENILNKIEKSREFIELASKKVKDGFSDDENIKKIYSEAK
ncbi:hypothetical protein [Halarcobacter ebronensis]|uniref:Glycosyltransferase n=1 Tax=Halarcobacter ebronensis TaxID=1462615 RepID=A0A4Q1AQR3_9BACT|nr:hypothetical protein [Halarcobacter ebronensis]QKF83306.1 hypothetical protein AEBR_2855 [Halarcobacter ebronensis]RXK05868.1 hypothetical protein CRV07_07290 [Halarcobacter ebronensis]